MEHSKKRRDRFMAIVVMGSFLLGSASSGFAAETAAPLPEPKATLSEAAAVKAESLTSEALVAAPAQAATAPAVEGGFFKSGKGKAALVLMVAAVGITVYAKYNDRVKSVIR